MEIRFVPNNLINLTSWDSCIEHAINGNIFAYSWYLNFACDNWNALISDDYSYVMPLPVYKKWGTASIEMPKMVEVLGIFSSLPIRHEIFKAFYNAIPAEYKYIKLTFNKFSADKLDAEGNGIKWIRAFEIDLISNYTSIQSRYSFEVKEFIANGKNFNFASGIQLIDMLQLYNRNPSTASMKLNNDILRRIRKISLQALRENSADIIGAYDNRNVLWAAGLFLSSHNKVFPIFFVQAKNSESLHLQNLLVDYFIRKHSEKNLSICVFENNSNSLSLNHFGAIQTHYPVMERNSLSWFQKTLKKLH